MLLGPAGEYGGTRRGTGDARRRGVETDDGKGPKGVGNRAAAACNEKKEEEGKNRRKKKESEGSESGKGRGAKCANPYLPRHLTKESKTWRSYVHPPSRWRGCRHRRRRMRKSVRIKEAASQQAVREKSGA